MEQDILAALVSTNREVDARQELAVAQSARNRFMRAPGGPPPAVDKLVKRMQVCVAPRFSPSGALWLFLSFQFDSVFLQPRSGTPFPPRSAVRRCKARVRVRVG
jgi:hypothetical protein